MAYCLSARRTLGKKRSDTQEGWGLLLEAWTISDPWLSREPFAGSKRVHEDSCPPSFLTNISLGSREPPVGLSMII